MPFQIRSIPLPAVLIGSLAILTACTRGGGPPAGAGAPPPTACLHHHAQPKPIEQASEFIATVRSLRSTTIQPEVEGVVTQIFVKSGDRVRAGTPLVQIDPDKQEATVRSTEANRTGAEADVQYWRQQVKRLESLVAAGAISRQEFEQAQNSLKTAEARLRRSTRRSARNASSSRYYRVVAPQAGVVGDIPIRDGRSRHEVDDHHDDRREHRARGVHPGADRSRPGSAPRPAGADARRRRQGRRDQSDHVRRAARRRVDAVGARQEPAAGSATDGSDAPVRRGRGSSGAPPTA